MRLGTSPPPSLSSPLWVFCQVISCLSEASCFCALTFNMSDGVLTGCEAITVWTQVIFTVTVSNRVSYASPSVFGAGSHTCTTFAHSRCLSCEQTHTHTALFFKYHRQSEKQQVITTKALTQHLCSLLMPSSDITVIIIIMIVISALSLT